MTRNYMLVLAIIIGAGLLIVKGRFNKMIFALEKKIDYFILKFILS